MYFVRIIWYWSQSDPFYKLMIYCPASFSAKAVSSFSKVLAKKRKYPFSFLKGIGEIKLKEHFPREFSWKSCYNLLQRGTKTTRRMSSTRNYNSINLEVDAIRFFCSRIKNLFLALAVYLQENWVKALIVSWGDEHNLG